jgi:tetratricopeptide (TPR) repeat protein
MPVVTMPENKAEQTPVPTVPAINGDAGKSTRWSDATLVALLLLVTLVCYANILANSFVYDDSQQILQNPYVKSWHFIPQIFGTTVWSFVGQAGATNYYRPLMTFTFLVLWKVFGPIPFGFHLFSLLMQFAVVVMLFYAGKRLFGDVRLAWLAALIFAVHPVHTEAVAWIAAVPDLQATFLLLLAIWLLSGETKRSWSAHLGIAAGFSIALLCKEPALMFAPLAVVFEHMCAKDRQQTTFFQKFIRYAPLCVLGIGYLLLRVALFGKLAPVLQRPQLTWPQTIDSALALVLQYTRLLFWPSRLSAFHVFHPSTSLFDAKVLAGAAICAACLAAIFAFRKRYPMVAFAILWLGVTLGPVLNARWMVANTMTERYLYLPSVGFCWLVAWCLLQGWNALRGSGGARALRLSFACILGALLVAGMIATVKRNRVWQSELTLYTRTLETDPDAYVIRNNLGSLYFSVGDLQRAESELSRALAGRPDSVNVMNALAMVYRDQGRYSESRELFARAITTKPLWSDPYFNLGILLEKQGQVSEALKNFAVAVQLAPLNPVAHYWYGDALLKAQEYPQAQAELQQSVALAPEGSFGAQSDLALVYLQTAQTEQAARLLSNMIQQFPYDSTAHFQLAGLLEAQGQQSEALREFQAGLALEPGNKDAASAAKRLESTTSPAPNSEKHR